MTTATDMQKVHSLKASLKH